MILHALVGTALALTGAILPLLALGSASTSGAVETGAQVRPASWPTPLPRPDGVTLTVAPSTAVEGERVVFTVQAATTFRRPGRVEYRAAGSWHAVRDFTMPRKSPPLQARRQASVAMWRALVTRLRWILDAQTPSACSVRSMASPHSEPLSATPSPSLTGRE